MPALRDLLAVVCRQCQSRGHRLPAQFIADLEREIRQTWPAQRVYISPADSRKDPARTEAIKRAAKTLPTGVAAKRLGVSESWVHRVVKKK